VETYQTLAAWAARNVEVPLFYLIAFLAIPLAYGVLFDPRIIRCGFLLIGVFGMISGIFLLLHAQFLAMAQLMIYAVGITLVVVIALMLTNPRMEIDATPSMPEHKWPAALVALAAFITIYLSLRSERWPIKDFEAASRIAFNELGPDHNVTRLGLKLIGDYALPFEFASVLLLIALIGSVALAKAESPVKPEEWIDASEDALAGKEDNVVKV
jgi:NADH:ubiquinone oxidoreductase subunit 6 (subunit J)